MTKYIKPMKIIIFISLFCLLYSCKSGTNSTGTPFVSADSLKTNIENFDNKVIVTEGTIIHVCPVDGRKMKLQGTDGNIIKIILANASDKFDRELNGEKVRIEGIAREDRLPHSYVDSLETAGALLCHIDNTPCNDTAWVANKHRQGVAEEIAQTDISRLRAEMEQTGKDYISVVVIIAQKVEKLKIVTEKIETSQNTAIKKSKNCGNCAFCGLCTKLKA